MESGDERGLIMKRIKKAMLVVAIAACISAPQWLPQPFTYLNQEEVLDTEGISQNRQIIARLHKSVDILEKRVDEALEQSKHRMKAARFIPVIVTAYTPVGNQTDSTPSITASNKQVKAGIVAPSRDIEEEYGFRFGDTVVLEGLGHFVFEDRMNKKCKRRVDILLFSREASKNFGVRHSFLVVDD